MKKRLLATIMALAMVVATVTPQIFATVDDTQSSTTNESVTTNVKYSQTSNFFVIVPKTITLDADKTSSYTVDANGDTASNEKIVVIPDETVTMKDVNSVKTDVIGTISQDKTEWLYNEMNVDATGSISVQSLTAGTWKCVFYFNIALANTENVVEDELTSEPTIKNLSTENVIDVNNSLSESRHEVN